MKVANAVAVLTLVGASAGCSAVVGDNDGQAAPVSGGGGILVPEIDGEWWQVAGNPDLGDFNSDDQQPTAFGMWQAADGTWQLWGCIRKTNVGGQTRLFYRWEGTRITDTEWEPKGIAMVAEPDYGETPGGLQSPHATQIGDEYLLVYGDWENICLARSNDGKRFERQFVPPPSAESADDLASAGRTGMFNEGLGNSTRDPMITKIGDLYHVYYTANPGGVGSVYCRTSSDLQTWSEPIIVSAGGSAGSDWFDGEVPYVLFHDEEQAFYLFRTHSQPHAESDTEQMMTSVYRSTDPLDFGVGHDDKLVTTLQAEASWIVREGDDFYIASVLPNLQGYRVARLEWVRR